ncbi:MAG: glycosyltransferase [Magnetococcales bacterium]|nr:glycosyltransferase [Magnetococcales bacterium]
MIIPELTVVVPTFNERPNIRPLVTALEKALSGMAWEVIFVDDDSPDGTSAEVHALAREKANVRCLRRLRRRGLSSACLEGMLASSAPCIAILDGDLQHDETLLPAMVETLQRDKLDLVVGCQARERHDPLAHGPWTTRLLSALLKVPVCDPLSGFFVVTRDFLERAVPNLAIMGFRILLDLLTAVKGPVRLAEYPYTRRERHAGTSTLDPGGTLELLLLLLEKWFRHYVPLRFLMFVSMGSIGALLHLAVMGLLLLRLEMPFWISQSVAATLAMTLNFTLNNRFTFRDHRLRGWGFLRGLLIYYGACSIGTVISVLVGDFLYEQSVVWWLAGFLGAVVASVWNFTTTATFSWNSRPASGGNG